MNFSELRTPGVYPEEVSLLPPSVAAVPTAVPAFIGYTQGAMKDGKEIYRVPTRIRSMAEFKLYFGGPPPYKIKVKLLDNNSVDKVMITPSFNLYYSLEMFYRNGGGPCYIVSVDKYSSSPNTDSFILGIESLKKMDEPTLLVAPETVLFDRSDSVTIQQSMIDQCAELKDRFAILDVGSNDSDENDSVENFRNETGINDLKYAAAYHPNLKTSLSIAYNYSNVELEKNGSIVQLADISSVNQFVVSQIDKLGTDIKKFPTELAEHKKTLIGSFYKEEAGLKEKDSATKNFYNSLKNYKASYTEASLVDVPEEKKSKILTTEKIIKKYADSLEKKFAILTTSLDTANNGDSNSITEENENKYIAAIEGISSSISAIEDELKNRANALEIDLRNSNPIYAKIAAAIDRENLILPPSGAIAGIYAKVDENRGVWKAPANVSLSNVIAPTLNINDKDQGDLNVDPNSGKSINAIRFFTGKGTLVWGARTLAGNDNEWRYIPVRRFFIFAEESIKKACNQFVFEPNDANTWVKVRAMIENFLFLQWRAGALQGTKPEHAFYVRVGLNQTMTAVDILEGRMIVEIGMAAVRPAEFIVLRFMHKMAES